MFYDIFSALCARNGISKTKAATDMGLSNATPTKWKNNGATPDGSTLAKVSKYFGVTVGYLLEQEDVSTVERRRTLYENIVSLCERRGVHPAGMCREVGVSQNLPTELKSGRKQGVTAETAVKIADYFGITVAELIGYRPMNTAACTKTKEASQKADSPEKAKPPVIQVKTRLEAKDTNGTRKGRIPRQSGAHQRSVRSRAADRFRGRILLWNILRLGAAVVLIPPADKAHFQGRPGPADVRVGVRRHGERV